MSQEDADVVTGRVGTPVLIKLQSVPSSGAIWYASTSDPGVELEAKPPVTAERAPGSQVEQVFEFKAAAAGTYRLRFDLKRVWEDVVRRERHVTVVVKEGK